jgi:hypothetical protein
VKLGPRDTCKDLMHAERACCMCWFGVKPRSACADAAVIVFSSSKTAKRTLLAGPRLAKPVRTLLSYIVPPCPLRSRCRRSRELGRFRRLVAGVVRVVLNS